MEIEYDDEGNVVGNVNSGRLNRLNAIADNSDGDQDHSDLEPYMPDDPANRADGSTDQSDDDTTDEVDTTSDVPKIKIKVNGKEMLLTQEELIERAQKVESADEYLRTAKAQVPAPPSPKEDVKPEPEMDLRDAVRALQMGSEDEAAAVLQKLMRPSVNTDAIIKQAADRVRFESDAAWFQDEYADVFGDEMSRRLVISMDEEAVRNGDSRPYRERYQDLGEKIRTWRGTTIQDKQARKASVVQPRTASAKQVPKTQDDEGPDDQAAISNVIGRGRHIVRY